jgi:hypothetical protein
VANVAFSGGLSRRYAPAMDYDEIGRRKGPPMVLLKPAAQRLGISVDALMARLAALQIAVVGRGERSQITKADVERLAAPVVTMEPPREGH